MRGLDLEEGLRQGEMDSDRAARRKERREERGGLPPLRPGSGNWGYAESLDEEVELVETN